MKFSVSRSDLLIALKRCSAAINPSYSPTRASIFMRVSSAGPHGSTDYIHIGATDGVLGVALKVPGPVTIPMGGGGKAMLPHKRLSAIVNELPDGSVLDFSIDDKTFAVVIKAEGGGKRRFTMSGFDPADYPPVLQLLTEEHETVFALEAKHLISAAADVKQSIDPSRVHGALLETQGKARFRMIAVGTDLSLALGELSEAHTRAEGGVLIPSILLDAAGVFGTKPDALVEVQHDDNIVRLLSDGCIITCAKLHQGFPGWYENVLAGVPKDPLFTCQAERFVESVRAVSVAADTDGAPERFIQIDVKYDGTTCLVSTRQSSKNYGEDELPVKPVGEPRTVLMHLDGDKLTRFLRAASPGEIEVYYDVLGNQEGFFLKGEAFLGMFSPVVVVDAPVKGQRS